MALKDWTSWWGKKELGRLNRSWINEKKGYRIYVMADNKLMNVWIVFIEDINNHNKNITIDFNNGITATKYAKKYMETH